MMKQNGETPGTEHRERSCEGGVNEMEFKEDLGFGNDRQMLGWPDM